MLYVICNLYTCDIRPTNMQPVQFSLGPQSETTVLHQRCLLEHAVVMSPPTTSHTRSRKTFNSTTGPHIYL